MTFLVDNNVGAAVRDMLRSCGHEADLVGSDNGLPGEMSDDRIYETACYRSAGILTHNAKHFDCLQPGSCGGIFILRFPKKVRGRYLVNAIREFFCGGEVEKHEKTSVVLTPTRFQVIRPKQR
jgi:hypothetical protein